MNYQSKLTRGFLIAVLASPFAVADDTEIYGTAGNTSNNLAKPNVMFIMDTSGSMSATVINRTPYEATTAYNGGYPDDHFFSSLNQNDTDGHANTALEQGDSTDCEAIVETLDDIGKVNGNFQQNRSGWRNSLSNGNDSTIRCNGGNNDWLYSGNYMNWFNNWNLNGGVNSGKDRLETVVDVVKGITNTISDVNMGLMRFDRDSGGGHVDVAIDDIASSKASIQSKLNGYTHNGATPLSEVMYEAALYFRGDTPEYGNSSSPNNSVAASKDGTKYKTPITAQCQKNHIILFTDGEATNDTGANTEIQNLIEDMNFDELPNLNKNCSGNGGCLDELAYWMNQTDHSTGADGYTETQNVSTYTIGGFDLDDASVLLNSTAVHGGGSFYQANNTEGLTEVLTEIFTEILATDSTFTAPAVSVNAFNASEHRNDLFYALFRPENNVKWGGNLKRYKVKIDEDTRDSAIVAYNIKQSSRTSTSDTVGAISDETGYFKEEVYGYWNTSDYPDGKNVSKGGAALQLTYEDRAVFSNTLADNIAAFDDVATFTSFGMSNTEFTSSNIKDWVKGQDILNADGDIDGDTTDNRFSIGDPLHSEPVVVSYGGDSDDPDATIFFGTNEGFIHGVSTDTGEEQFAFIPYELHDIQQTYFENTEAVGEKPYGMDGPITVWFKDLNNNLVLKSEGKTTVDTGEHAYLYAGMRRGGRSYYALDVTDRDNPTMLFRITGGETTGFDKLGQTWSKMTIAKVKWDDESKFVLIFTGGYDENQDTNNTRENDSMGNAIYMVDATTGDLLWTASNSNANLILDDMKNSMPASASVIDITGDGFVNTIFTADTGGRVFRVDINQDNTGASNFATGGLVAQIGDASTAGNQRFYNKPNVATVEDLEYGNYFSISIGSGYRAHPLNTTITDRFYMIKDRSPYKARTDFDEDDYEHITEATSSTLSGVSSKTKLYNATSAMDGTISNDLKTLITGGGGWYIDLNPNEKVLSESLTYAGAILFSTFAPKTDNTAACGADTGTARVYGLSQRWATPGLTEYGFDGASKVLKHDGIPPRPVMIYVPSEDGTGSTPTPVVGLEILNKEKDDGGESTASCDNNNCFVTPVYWHQNDNDNDNDNDNNGNGNVE